MKKLKRLVEKSKPYLVSAKTYVKKLYPLFVIEFTRSFLATLLGKFVDLTSKILVGIMERVRPITKITRNDFKRLLKFRFKPNFNKKKLIFQIKRWAIISKLFVKFLAQAVFEYCVAQVSEFKNSPKKKLISVYVFTLKKIGAVLDFFEKCILQIIRYFTYKKVVWLVITTLIIEFSSPILPAFLPLFGTIYANGNITTSGSNDFMFESTNPNFKAKFGNKKSQTEQKMVFEAKGKQMEVKMLDIADASESSESINKDEILNALDKPRLTIKEAAPLESDVLKENSALVDAVEQRVSSNVSIAHEIIPGKGVKESIIIDEPIGDEKISGKFAFIITVDKGVVAKRSPALNDVWYFVDKYGRYLYHFEEPYAIDASKQMNKNVSLTLTALTPVDNVVVDTVIQKQTFFEKLATELGATIDSIKNKIPFVGDNSKTQYLAVVSADSEWMNDAGRVFPVTIDPTIVQDSNPNFASGVENRSQINTSNAVESQFKELQADINTVGLWHFNEGSSTTAYDASGNSNTGTLTNGPVWNGPTDTQVGLGKSSLKFNGISNYATVPNDSKFSFGTADFSVETWIYPTTVGVSQAIIGANSASPPAGQWYFRIASNNKLEFGHWTAADNYSNSTLSANQWSHVAVTRTGSTLMFYINGILDYSGSNSYNYSNTAGLLFGTLQTTTGFFNGTVDEVRISNRARTPEEIAASASRFPYSVHESPVIDFGSTPNTLDSLNYSATGVQTGDGEKPFSSDGLVAQWNFNETSGTIAYNTSGSAGCGGTPASCNGTLTTFASTSSQDQAAGTGWTANNRRFGAGALMFDGSDDYVAITDNNSLDFASDFSTGAWFKTNQVPTGQANILSKGTNPINYDITLTPAGKIQSELYDGTNNPLVTSPKTYNDGNWHYAMFVRNTTTDKIYLYIDGSEVGNATDSTTGTITNAVNLFIGTYSTTNYRFNGVIDSPSLYSRALSASEILSNFQSGNIEFQTRTGATSTPNDGTWEAWKTTSGTGDTQIDAMDATTGWAWDGNASDPTSVALDTTTKIEGTGSLKNIIGMPEADANTVGLWHMDETSGSGAYIKDATANANHGTPTGTTVVDGFYGKGRSFNGSSDYVTLPDMGTVEAYPFTFEAWFKTSASSDNNQAIVVQSNSADTTYRAQLYFGGGTLRWNVRSTTEAEPTASGEYRDGKWHYAVGVSSASNDHKLYVDGALAASSTTSVTAPLVNAARIGDWPGQTDYYFNGLIDEVRISNTARSADEIAEAYRAGRDHRISKTISSTDLSAKTKIPFFVAADRPGTFLEATVGESAFANYEPDANTVGLWHLEEAAGSGAYIKDSANSNHLTPTASSATQGYTGKARLFSGGSEYLSNTSLSPTLSSDLTIQAWFKTSTTPNVQDRIIDLSQTSDTGIQLSMTTSGTVGIDNSGGPTSGVFTSGSYIDGKWHYLVVTRSSTTYTVYVDGVSIGTSGGTAPTYTKIWLARRYNDEVSNWAGSIDETRVDNTARTADQIRQAYEIGKRTHAVTIDFKADLDSSNLITSTSDLSFAIQPDTDVTANSLNINKGEKIIVKENVNGTEYIAQGNVTNVTYESNTSNVNAETQDKSTQGSVTTVTVTSWDSGSTVPSGGFTTAATVFKWQREYFDLTQIPLSTQRDAVTRLSLRVIDGSQGANVWIDDFESADYSDGSRVAIGSTPARYFQYRAVITTGSTSTLPLSSSPALTNVTINYNSGTTAQAPKVKDASSDFSATGTSLNRVTDTGSSNSPSLELAYKELPKDINTVGLWHMNNAWTDSSGNSINGTANGNATFTTSTKLGSHAGTFDGTGDFISTSTHAALNFSKTSIFSIEAWVKSSTLNTHMAIVSRYDITAVKGYFLSLFNASATVTNALMQFQTDGGNYFYRYGNTHLADGNWHHVVGVYDGTGAATGIRLYVDGKEESSYTAGSAGTVAAIDSGEALRIGTRDADLDFNGQIDEVRISNIARTPEEIKYDAGRRPYGVYTSDVQNLGTKVSSIDNIRWTENGVQTGDGEVPFGTSSLVAQWNFNETSGTTAAVTSTSSCGSTCNGTLTSFASTTSQDQAAGTGWTKDNRKWGNGALMFDGTNDYVNVTKTDLFDAFPYTIETWIKPAKTNVAQYIFGKGTDDAPGYTLVGLSVESNGGIRIFTLNTSNAVHLDATSGANILSPGQWYHVTAVVQTSQADVYVNGVLVASDTSASGTYKGPQAWNTAIGQYRPTAGGAYFNGVVDSFRVYNRALGTSEILSDYQSGNVELQTRTGTTTTPNDGTWEEWRPSGNSTEVQLDNLQTLSPVQKINTTNLVGYWKLDEVSGNRADSAGSNTLTDNATVTSKAGHLNLAGQFTAANSEYLSIADNADLSLGNFDFTYSAWVYLDSKGADRSIVSRWETTFEARLLYANTTDRFLFQISDGVNPTITTTANNLGSPSLANWYRIVAWYDSVANIQYIQVNGGTPDSTANSTGSHNSATSFLIGRGTGGEYWNGRIDEVAMWKRVLTADERRILYEDGLDKTNDSVIGGINRTIDSTTKFEGSGSEKLSIGSPQVDSSTVGLWHLDETSGTGAYIQDATANNNDGTPTGTTVVDGFYGKGRSFNGSSDYVGISSPTSGLTSGGTKTVSAWIKISAATSSIIYTAYDGTNGYQTYVAVTTGYFSIWSDGGGVLSSSTAVNDGKWHHVSGVWDGTNGYTYVDGVQKTSGARTITADTATQHQIGVQCSGSCPTGAANYFNGSIDEVKIDNTARTADEIAEAYRAGRDHRLSKSFDSAQDLSAKTKLPFYVASDRPGTFMEATVGESAYANYEPDANSRALWHLEEQTGTAPYIKDSSGLGNNLSIGSGTTFSQGKIGKARDFNGSSEYLECTHANCGGTTKLDTNGTSWSFGAWVYGDTISAGGTGAIMGKLNGAGSTGWLLETYQQKLYIVYGNGSTQRQIQGATTISTGAWHYVVGTVNNGVINAYLDGKLDGTVNNGAESIGSNTTDPFRMGTAPYSLGNYWDGRIDEAFVSASVKTPDEIRQAYEVGKRTHQITNDFVTAPQATYSSGTSVTINNPYGTANLTDTLSVGDTMIFKENVGGTETVSQAVVTAITNTSSVYGTVTVASAPSFPSGGYTTNATVFKWQREFWDISQIRPMGQIDAINRITLRVTDGSQGANIWIDDIKAAGPYLTQSTTRTASVTSTPRQYMQYRIIFSTTDPLVSPTVTSVSVQTHSSPVKVVGSDTLGADGSFDKDGNLHLGSNNVKKVAFYDRTKDQISYALDFDGSNDKVSIASVTGLPTGANSKTFETWVYPTSSAADYNIISSGTETTSQRFNLIRFSAGTVIGFSGYFNDITGTLAVPNNQWSHLAVTYDGTTLSLYVNGVLDPASTAKTLNTVGTNMQIGVGNASDNYFPGAIDEVAIFSTARTAAQVTADYNARRLSDTTTGLVGLWHFDEGQGTRAYDSSGNNNHGTLTNMAATAWVNSQNDRDQSALSVQTLGIDPNWANGVGRESYAWNGDGSNDYINVPDNASLRPTNITVEAWFKTTGTGDQNIVRKNKAAGASYIMTMGVLGSGLPGEAAGKIQCARYNGSWGGIVSSVTSNDGNWHQASCVYDGTNMVVYIDAVQQGTAAVSALDYTGSDVLVMGGTAGVGQTINGQVDEISIWNTARTAAQISSDYNSRRLKGNETNLQALWHLDEGTDNLCSGGTNDVCDATTNANDGANTNGPTWVTDARAVMDNNARYVSLNSQSSNPNDKGMEIYAISTTQFKYRWTGDQTWSSAVNFSSYPFATPVQLGTTGVYVGFDTTNGVFGDESYFLIPSWAIQQFSSSRGIRRSFPERSYLISTDRGIDIIDADDNTLWMRTTNGVANNLLGTQTLNVPSGITMTQGQLMVSTNGTAGTGVYRLDFNRDTAYRYNVTNRTTGTNNLAKRNATDWSWGSADTGQNLIDSIVNDVSLLVINGKCVTGDTLLRRRRRKNGKWVYDDVRIDEIEIGDEILSLNEKTGKFEWQTVEAKKNMGVKDTWQIITESGKKIRATKDHKFLVRDFDSTDPNYIQKQTLEYSESLARNFYFEHLSGKKTLSKALKDSVMFTHSGWNHFEEKSRSTNELITRYFALTRVKTAIKHANKIADYEKRVKADMTIEYWSLETIIESILVKAIVCSVNGGQKFFLSCVWKGEQKERGVIMANKKELSLSAMPRRRELVIPQLFSNYSLLNSIHNVKWHELRDIRVGQLMMTDEGLEQVVSIKKDKKETVWDIRVSKNHNFVGNGLVAHNCMLATANNTGLTKIANIMSNDTSYDYSDVTSNAYNRVKLGENYLSGTGAVGDMYALNSTNNALERWNNVVADAASETNGTPDATVNATSTPALFASAQTVNDLDVKTGTSLANAGNNTVFVGHNGGTTTFQENRATLASSSVKYYSKDNISEEMIGDTNGMWSLDDVNDSSVKANNLTNNASVTFTTSGVRGKSAHFTWTSSQYLSKADNASLSTGDIDFAVGAWIYLDSTAGGAIITKQDGATPREYKFEYISAASARFSIFDASGNQVGSVDATTFGNLSVSTWYFIVGWHDSVNNLVGISVNNISNTSATTGAPTDTVASVRIGALNSTPSSFFDGRIDEVLFTKEVLSAAQRTQLYVSGKEALNNKYRVKLASDTVNELAGSINVVKGVAASDQYIFAGTNTTGADDGILSRTLLRGDVTDRSYDESTTDPVITDNDINSVAVSKDGAYIIVGTDDQGITIIQNGSNANRLRSGGKVQGPSKRPSN